MSRSHDIELLVRPEFAKAKTNNPSLERLEVIWWQALITSLVFSDHDDTGPASAKHYTKKMLAKVGKEVCEFDLEKDLAIVIEFVLWNVQKAREDFKMFQLKLSGEEESRIPPRDNYQKALSLVREKLVITLVLFAFLSRINPELDKCKRRSKCLELLEEAFRLCVGMLCAEAFYEFNDTDERPSAFITLCRTAVKVRCLYGSLVGDRWVQDQVMIMAYKDIDVLALCCPKSDQLSEFDKIGIFFFKEELSDPQRHTEQSTAWLRTDM